MIIRRLAVLLLLAALMGAPLLRGEDAGVAALRAQAEKGDAAAQNNLGVKYDKGEGVTQDFAEAVKWYRRAADQDYALAQYNLGLQYFRGNGVREDSIEAARWFRKAAEQGEAHAALVLGNIYMSGVNAPKDNTEAAKWYRMAAGQGEARAQANLGILYGAGAGVPQDDVEAMKWLQMAANQGDAFAQFLVGIKYLNGEGVTKNMGEAVKWFRMAANRGYSDAQLALGLYYREIDESKADLEAVKWLRMASMQGSLRAQHVLGLMYRDGRGVPKDEIEGLALFILADAEDDAKMLQQRLGPEKSLQAQQRSREILKDWNVPTGNADRSDRNNSGASFASFLPPAQVKYKSSGSGAIVTKNGYILTAAHVIAGATTINVVTVQGMTAATAVKIDPANDVAVLKINGGTFEPLPIGPSQRVRLGQTVSTIGFPKPGLQGFSPKFTKGDISSLNGIQDEPMTWQISVPVQPGNSGGPLLDENGNLIGVVVKKLNSTLFKDSAQLPENVNYAVKSAYALALVKPYLDDSDPKPNLTGSAPKSEDMIEKAELSIVLILVY